MTKKKSKSLNRNKFIVNELNRILTHINKYPDYTFSTGKKGKGIFLSNGVMRKNVSHMAIQLSISLKINSRKTFKENLDIEKTHHYLEKCIKYQENKFNQNPAFLSYSDYKRIETMINRELIGAEYKILNSSKGAIIIDRRPIYIGINQEILYGDIKSDHLDHSLLKLIYLTQNQCAYDLRQHLKRIVSDEYTNNKYQEFIDSESYTNLKSMLDEIKKSITAEVISFFEVHQGILNRYGLQLNVPLFQSEQSDIITIKRDLFHVTFQVGKEMIVDYCVLSHEPDNTGYQKAIDIYGNLLTFLLGNKQIFKLFHYFESLKRKYYECCDSKLEEARISISEVASIKAYRDVPSLIPFIKGKYFVYQWKNDKIKIFFDTLSGQFHLLSEQIASDFSELQYQFISELSDYQDELHKKISEPTMKAVLEIIRDFPRLKKEVYIHILRGSRRLEIIDRGYHLHSSYGALKHCKVEEIEKKIDVLIKCGQVKECTYRLNQTTFVGYSIKN